MIPTNSQILIPLSLFFLSFLVLPARAQQEVISLWEGKIPGSIETPGYEGERNQERPSWLTKVVDPTLEVFESGKGTTDKAAVVICPGGGYQGLAMEKEGQKMAEWFAARGITAFVLKYRLPHDSIMQDKSIGPLQDAQRALRYVRNNRDKWGIAADKIGILGFSAGGHLAASLSTRYNDTVYTNALSVSARPDLSILIYPVISMAAEITHMGSRESLLGEQPSQEQVLKFSNEEQVDKNTPSTFLVHAADDQAVPVENSLRYFSELKEHAVPVEMHIYEDGGHGFGLGRMETSNSWSAALELWLEKHGWIRKKI